MPDIMRGDSINNPENADKDVATWSNSEADLACVFKHVAGKGIKDIGSVGFCWGGWVIFRASAVQAAAVQGALAQVEAFLSQNL